MQQMIDLKLLHLFERFAIRVPRIERCGPSKGMTEIIVVVRVNGDHKVFMYHICKGGTLVWPPPHVLEYN
jgi:hypothetical protein